jgi:hypothetical protein
MKIESNENRKKVNKEPGPGKGPDQNTIIGYAIKLMLNILHCTWHSQPINTLGNGLESNRFPTPAPEYRHPTKRRPLVPQK